MMVNDITELVLYDVIKRGVPNQECIPIQAKTQVNLGQYGLMIGMSTSKGHAMPIRDNLFWFGDGLVQPDDWIFVYTCGGTPQKTKAADNRHAIYIVHWDRSTTLFSNSHIVPILFRVDAANVGNSPSDLPQLSLIR